jgi:hypothetical protein
MDQLFSETYAQARAKFQQAAEKAGLMCTSWVMEEKGVEGEELAIDVVCLGAREPRQLVMISSGAHGVEGFAGSAIQIGRFRRICDTDRLDDGRPGAKLAG